MLPELAQRFFISPYYLSRSFKMATGFSLGIEYINLTRVREAQRLLRETNLKVIVIAERTGFENHRSFRPYLQEADGHASAPVQETEPVVVRVVIAVIAVAAVDRRPSPRIPMSLNLTLEVFVS